jgi:hypothetical protein
MNRRDIAALTVGVMATASLAGCVSSPTAAGGEGTPTAASTDAACTPGTSTIWWDEANTYPEQPVGGYVLEYPAPAPGADTAEASSTTPVELEPGLEVEYPGDGLNLLTDFDVDAVDEWKIALLNDLQRTGQVPRDFGDPITLSTTPSGTMQTGAAGTYAQVMSMDKVSVPFEIDCGGEITTGSVEYFSTTNSYNAFYECSALPDDVSLQVEVAKTTCAAA